LAARFCPAVCWRDMSINFSPEDGDSMFLRNVGMYRRVYTALQLTRTPTSSPPWEPQISQTELEVDVSHSIPVPLYLSFIILMAYSKAKLKSNDDKAYPCFRPLHHTNVYLYGPLFSFKQILIRLIKLNFCLLFCMVLKQGLSACGKNADWVWERGGEGTLGPKTGEVRGWRKLHNENLHNLYS
jgi:hypothetical protein